MLWWKVPVVQVLGGKDYVVGWDEAVTMGAAQDHNAHPLVESWQRYIIKRHWMLLCEFTFCKGL